MTDMAQTLTLEQIADEMTRTMMMNYMSKEAVIEIKNYIVAIRAIDSRKCKNCGEKNLSIKSVNFIYCNLFGESKENNFYCAYWKEEKSNETNPNEV